jgi:AraC-like DNA-binding protein
MHYQEIQPSDRLKHYIKCYYLFESDTTIQLEDTIFPGGHMEVIFNLGEGVWKLAANETFYTTPPIELWGQITKPTAVRSSGKNRMLGIRFFAHSAAYFFEQDMFELNDQVTNAMDVLGNSVRILHLQLLETPALNKRIELIEHFLLLRLSATERKQDKMSVIGEISKELQSDILSDNIKTIASRYAMSPRYLQRLFLQYTGVTPKLYHKINRFQLSLKLVTKKDTSLTSIAYDCGYFDQSHFIREFKSFTGVTPSAYTAEAYPVSLAIGG